jgi:hypothetical protein
MLRGLAVFAMRGHWQAAMVIALLSSAALMVPPLSYLASGIIVLSTLRMGPKEGIKVLLAAMVIFIALAGFILNELFIPLLFLLSAWLPVFAITMVLGYSRSLAVTFIVAASLGLLLVTGFYLVLSEPALWWQELLRPFTETLAQQPGWTTEQAQNVIADLVSMMSGVLAAGFSMNLILGVLLGRSWQASLYNPGGFADEFQQLTLGKLPAALTAVLFVIAVLPIGSGLAYLRECLLVMVVVFSLQGVAVVHAIVRQQQRHKAWLIIMYVLLLIMMPQMVVFLAMIGVLEQWFNYRQRSLGQ